MINKLHKLSMVAITSLLLFACVSGAQKPTDLLATTEADIEIARSHDAEEYAPLALNRAKQYMQEAQRLISQKHYEQARMILEKAAIEAELATVKIQADKSSQAALAIQRDLQLLENEITEP